MLSKLQKEVYKMTKLKIKLSTINDIKAFVNASNLCDFEIDLICGRYSVDAKSIMGIFSLDLSSSIDVQIYEDNCGEYLDAIAPFIVE